VVAKLMVRRGFRSVSIRRHGNSLGRVRSYRRRISVEALEEMAPGVAKKFEHDIVIFLAGPEAERLVTGRYSYVGAHSDHQYVAKRALQLVHPDEATLYVTMLTIRARRIVSSNRQLLDAVAAALLEHATLRGPAQRQVIFDCLKVQAPITITRSNEAGG
jgi:hypothetical protein